MDPRRERIARNEILFRAVNREIEEVSAELGETEASRIEVLCECGQEGCREVIALTMSEYDEAHRHEHRFLLLPGHETPDLERVVEAHGHYVVVEKIPPD